MTTLFPAPIKEALADAEGNMPQRWKSWFSTVFDYLVGTGQFGTTTLKISSAITVINAPNCDNGSVVILTPTTANAAAEAASTHLYIVSGDGEFTIHHTNSATTVRTFNYVILG